MTDAGLGLVIGFALVVATTLGIARSAVRTARPGAAWPFTIGACVWLGVLAVLALQGFFRDVTSTPPHLAVAIGPPMLAIVLLFVLPSGRRFLDTLPLKTLTYLHLIRAGIELVLFGLATDHLVPVAMTFAGRNFDIISGFTAPLFGNLAFPDGRPARGPLLIWNVVTLGLLVHVVISALAAVGDGTNVAVLEFPFVWLPGFVVPIVLGSHLVAFWQLRK